MAHPGRGPGGVTALAASADAAQRDARSKITRRFPASCGSVALARHFLLDHLGGRYDEGVELAALMLSELATNAVQHAATEFEVAVTTTPEAGGCSVHVRVTDWAPGFPAPQEPPAESPHGRGLRIVEALADAWGVEVRRGRSGKAVWFTTLAVAAGREDGGTDDIVVLAALRPPAAAGVGPERTGGGRFVV